jgi:hypothetical protein
LDAPIPQLQINADSESLAPNTENTVLDGNIAVSAGDEFLLKADHLEGARLNGVTVASGHVFVRELATEISASKIKLDGDAQTGEFLDADVFRLPYRVRAAELSIRPSAIVATDAIFNTAAPGERDYYAVKSKSLTYDRTAHVISATDASVFFLGKRLFSVPRLNYELPQQVGPYQKSSGYTVQVAHNRQLGPNLAVGDAKRIGSSWVDGIVTIPLSNRPEYLASAHYILFNPKTPQSHVTAPGKDDVVRLVRTIAEAPGTGLPADDPLLFHDFIGRDPFTDMFRTWGNSFSMDAYAETEISHQVYGTNINNLWINALPQVGLEDFIPILGPQILPDDGDPQHVRAGLRQIALRAFVDPSSGYYQEFPTRTHGWRSQVLYDLTTRAILVSPNTLFIPTVSYENDDYAKGAHQGIAQTDLALQHLFDTRTAVGLEYQRNWVSGTSPFVFDVPISNNQLSALAQYGNQRFILGYRINASLQHPVRVENYTAIVGRQFGCLIPEITYQGFSGNLGVHLDIRGLTF